MCHCIAWIGPSRVVNSVRAEHGVYGAEGGPKKWVASRGDSNAYGHSATGSNLKSTNRLMKAAGAQFVGEAMLFKKSPMHKVKHFIFFLFSFFTALSNGVFAEENNFGVTYFIENKDVVEKFYSLVNVYAQVKNKKIVINGRAKNGIVAISLKNSIVNGAYNLEKIHDMSENDKRIFKKLSPESELCSIGRVSSKEAGTKESVRTVVVFNTLNGDEEEQIKCLYAGLMLSTGHSVEFVSKNVNSDVDKLIKLILFGGEN